MAWSKIHEVDSTKRARIRAYEETEVARIKAAEKVLKNYLEQVFAERRKNFEELFPRLGHALEDGNRGATAVVLRSIVDIARTSPLAGLGDLSQIRAALDDPDRCGICKRIVGVARVVDILTKSARRETPRCDRKGCLRSSG